MAHFFRRRFASVTSLCFTGLPLLLLVGSVLFVTGCHPRVTDPKDPKFIVAEKGSWSVTRGELDKEITSYLQAHQMTPDQIGPAKMPLLETAMLDNIVLKKLIQDRAAALPLKDVDKAEADTLDRLKQRLPPGKTFDDQLKASGMTLDDLKKRIHEEILAQKVLEAEAFQNSEPTEQEINDLYVQNKDRFITPQKLRASRVLILVDPKMTAADKATKMKAINKAHDQVVHGEDFAKVAQAVSDDKYSAPKGGDIGFFRRGENEDPKFDEVAFSTKVGSVSAVFETPLGYQFLKVTEDQPAGVVSVADARSTITNYLRNRKKSEQAMAYTKKLLADSGVIFHLVRVPMPDQNGAPNGPAPQPQAPQAPAAPAPAPEAATAPSTAVPPK